MAPIVVAKSGMVMTLLSRVTSAMPMPTPLTAMPTGMPMARTEPNARISTTMANARPISSDSGGSNSPSAAPPTSTRSPSTSGSMSTISAPISALSVWSMSLVRST